MFITSNAVPVLRTKTECYLHFRGNEATLPPAKIISFLPSKIGKHFTTATVSVPQNIDLTKTLDTASTLFKIVFDHWLGIIGLCILIKLYPYFRAGIKRHNDAMKVFMNCVENFKKVGTVPKKFGCNLMQKVDGDAIAKYPMQVIKGAKGMVQDKAHQAMKLRQHLAQHEENVENHVNKAKQVFQEIFAMNSASPTTVNNWLNNARTRKWRPSIVKAFNFSRPVGLLKENLMNVFNKKELRDLSDKENLMNVFNKKELRDLSDKQDS